jgi:hypothetical protein
MVKNKYYLTIGMIFIICLFVSPLCVYSGGGGGGNNGPTTTYTNQNMNELYNSVSGYAPPQKFGGLSIQTKQKLYSQFGQNPIYKSGGSYYLNYDTPKVIGKTILLSSDSKQQTFYRFDTYQILKEEIPTIYKETFSKKSDSNEKFYLSYNSLTTLTRFSDLEEKNEISINSVISLPNLKNSRVITARKSGNVLVYGYDHPYKNVYGQTNTNLDLVPVYSIIISGESFDANKCFDTLKHYDSTVIGLNKRKLINCFNNQIIINSGWLGDNIQERERGYTIFLDIITDLELSKN